MLYQKGWPGAASDTYACSARAGFRSQKTLQSRYYQPYELFAGVNGAAAARRKSVFDG